MLLCAVPFRHLSDFLEQKAEARKSYQKGGSGATMTQPMTRPLLGLRR